MTTAVDRLAADMGTSPYEVAAAALLAASGCNVRKWRTHNSGVALSDDDWGIEVPRPRGPVSFGIFAHEIGHQMLHRRNSLPRWKEEVEAEEYALAAFDKFGLKGRERYEARVPKHLAHSFAKAIMRGVDPELIAASAPVWWERAKEARPARISRAVMHHRRTNAGASDAP